MTQARCIIVEDQALIGMSLEAFLEDAGYAVAGVFMSKAEALRWLEGDVPDIAVLDIMIRDGTSLEVARTLRTLGVPFAVYSGLPSSADCPAEFKGVPWLEKPVSRETLAEVLGRLAAPEKPAAEPIVVAHRP
ncbi:response regulator [Microvirga arsenatis]|uniref:Response regulator n=1 Tax=Microvirga arsenatis TaxID=2692265 RepID=A0ABW9YTZ6_9HYPH|nr:response regulator [Microvirga arsenatis]NBJ09299.1 response regulator [Microvirga arsenatis]NBJ23843.1 response regulator [Microvirga arsenatis]